MDIYSEVQSSDPADLINSPFGGRYCGPNLPRRRISLYRAIALSFFTGKNATTAELFTGRFSFINACKCQFLSIQFFFKNIFYYFRKKKNHSSFSLSLYISIFSMNNILTCQYFFFLYFVNIIAFDLYSNFRNRYANNWVTLFIHNHTAQK